MSMKQQRHFNRNKQKGNVLVIFVILIAMMTTISITSTDNAKFEQSMAGNTQYKMQLFNDAEKQLVSGEKFLLSTLASGGSEQTFATYKASSPAGVSFSASNTNQFTVSSVSGVTFEHLHSSVVVDTTETYPPLPSCGNGGTGCLDYYQVTASGTGAGSGFTGASSTVESIFTVFVPYTAP